MTIRRYSLRFPQAVLISVALFPLACSGDGYEQAFGQRAAFTLKQVAKDNPKEIMEWSNRINLGDPHKYALGPIMARLALNPGTLDPNVARALAMLNEVNTNKGDRGLYHFAAYQRARLYIQFRTRLPQSRVKATEYDVKNHFGQMTHGGTENHGFMHRTSGYIFSEYIEGPYKSRRGPDWLEQWLKGQVNKFYTAGQGEYDSSTYVAFTAAGWSNIYDFSKRENMRKLSKAALHWLAAAQALKYFHGCNMGPESRGFAKSAVTTITDRVNWLWFGNSARPVLEQGWDKPGRALHAVTNLALSDYRPHPVIRDLAAKKVKLPFEARNSKPQYYPAEANKDQEYLYVAENYAMGTLYSPEKGVRTKGTILPQTTLFKASLRDANDVRTFGASNGYHGHFPLEGRTPYDQYHQKRAAALNVCYVYSDEDQRTRHRSILGFPVQAGDPLKEHGWFFWKIGKAYLAARPLNGKASVERVTAVGKSGKAETVDSKTHRWLVSPGRLGGWAIQLGQAGEYGTFKSFRKAVGDKCRLDLSEFQDSHAVTFTSLQGDVLTLKSTVSADRPGGRPVATTNGTKLDYTTWPVFDSPYLREKRGSGILTVSNGQKSLIIDVTGEWPVFSEGEISD